MRFVAGRAATRQSSPDELSRHRGNRRAPLPHRSIHAHGWQPSHHVDTRRHSQANSRSSLTGRPPNHPPARASTFRKASPTPRATSASNLPTSRDLQPRRHGALLGRPDNPQQTVSPTSPRSSRPRPVTAGNSPPIVTRPTPHAPSYGPSACILRACRLHPRP